MKGPIYIAGPMRGLPHCNFPAFDEASKAWGELGWMVISPAELDREHGFFGEGTEPGKQFLREAILRDLNGISVCTAIVLLPGWEQSKGVAVELALARFLGLKIYEHATMREIE